MLAQPYTRYWFWLKGITGQDLRLAQPHMILVLVKGDHRTRSQVSPTTQILILVQGDRPMGSHRKKKERKIKKRERKKKRERRKGEGKKEEETFRVFLYKAYYAKH